MENVIVVRMLDNENWTWSIAVYSPTIDEASVASSGSDTYTTAEEAFAYALVEFETTLNELSKDAEE